MPAEANDFAGRLRELYVREPRNPILKPEDMPMPCKAVCNPGAVEFEGDVLLLLRVIGHDDHSTLVVARSQNGVTDWRIEEEPLLKAEHWYDEWGCEDPRVTWMEDRQQFVIVYVGYSRFGAGVCLATTEDFKTATKLGMAIHPYNKDAALLPERIDGKYRLFHRPTMGRFEDIWVSESEDLIHWGMPFNVMQQSDRPGWQGGKIGCGPPPFMGGEDWVMVYHGVERADDHWVYRVGMAALQRDAPQNVVRAWPEWVFGPQEPYEFDDRGQGIVFPTGQVHRDGKLMLYYGAGDRSVALVTASLEGLRQVGHDILQTEAPAPAQPGGFHENRPEERK